MSRTKYIPNLTLTSLIKVNMNRKRCGQKTYRIKYTDTYYKIQYEENNPPPN